MISADRGGPLKIYLIAGEESGDQLGAGLIQALSRRLNGNVMFFGVGGGRMAGLGLKALFPISELSYGGLSAVLLHIPQILRRMGDAVEDILRTRPDVLVVIDSPDFNLRVARRVRRKLPSLPIVDYVSPTVWAWRQGRSRAMAKFIDHVLALLPFEPEVHRRLGGPPCTYVGHPLIERLDRLRPAPGERSPLGAADRPVLLVLPGSRRSEIVRHLAPFGQTIGLIVDRMGPVDLQLPAVPHLVAEIERGTAAWPIRPTIIQGEDAKFAAFRRAHAALAASGTVTLELALAGVPMVVGYRVDRLLSVLEPLLTVQSVVLPNLILGSNDIPEFLNRKFTPDRLAATLLPLLHDTPERAAQLAAFRRLDQLMSLEGSTPTTKAAEVVLEVVAGRGGQSEVRSD
jgi:lipid-A-disaccharide synthase